MIDRHFAQLLLPWTLFFAGCVEECSLEITTPAYLGAPGSNAITDAIQVWERGASYIDDVPEPDWENLTDAEFDALMEEDDLIWHLDTRPFSGIDEATAVFLDSPSLRNAVHFGCVVNSNYHAKRYTEALHATDPSIRLQALVILMRVKAPRSIEDQKRTLEELRRVMVDPLALALLERLRKEFSEAHLRPVLAQDRADFERQWAIRAAGIEQHRDFLPRLAQLATSKDMDTSLAAVRSLEDFTDASANAALLECVLAWEYDSSERAARKLMQRAPEFLKQGLLAHIPRENYRHRWALMLGRLDAPKSVPALCETVVRRSIIDREMFDLIEKLAIPEHRAIIEKLPEMVREEQKTHALKVRGAVLARFDADHSGK